MRTLLGMDDRACTNDIFQRARVSLALACSLNVSPRINYLDEEPDDASALITARDTSIHDAFNGVFLPPRLVTRVSPSILKAEPESPLRVSVAIRGRVRYLRARVDRGITVRIIGVPRTSATRYDFSWDVIGTRKRPCAFRGSCVKLLDRVKVKEERTFSSRGWDVRRENTPIRC